MWQKKPDYLQMLSDKFSTEFGLDCDLTAQEQLLAQKNATGPNGQMVSQEIQSDEDDELSEENLLMSKARGRH